jgi:hypothetical protein
MKAVRIVIALLMIFGSAAAARAERVRATLIGYQEVPSVSTEARGEFRAMISRDGQSIEYELTFSGLQAPVTQSHIHFAQRGVNGSIVIWLCGTPGPTAGPPGTQTCPQSGTISGTITAANVISAAPPQQLTAGELDEVIAAIRAGSAYVNVHSAVSAGGEIRGQLRASDRDDH